MGSVGRLGRVLRVNVEVLQDDGLAESRLVVDPGAPVTMPTSTDFKVKRTIDFVLFGAEN